MKKNRLAQSGPRRTAPAGGAILQESIATRAATPNAAPLDGTTQEVSSGAALGGTDMRPALTPISQESDIEVELYATIDRLIIGVINQPVVASLEISDDAGSSWVPLTGAEVANLPQQQDNAGNDYPQRHYVRTSRIRRLLDLIPDYEAGTEVIARATLTLQNTPGSQLVSEATPGNCRVTVREIRA